MKPPRRVATTALVLLLAAAPALAQLAPEPGSYVHAAFTDSGRAARVAAVLPEIDAMYAELAKKERLPGLVYGVVMDGKLVHVRSIGFANLERKTPAGPATPFRIASMTKSFAAMALLQLRDRGKLRLDDPAADHLPELRKLRLPTSDSPPLTLRHLLTMSTGLPEDNPWGDRQMAADNAAIERIVGAGLSFSNAPGMEYEYSNLGYILLGKVAGKVSGMRFQDYITQNILLPLGMKDTNWEYGDVAGERFAQGYRRDRDNWVAEPVLHDGDGAAMGGLITTMDDFSRYVAFHLDAWPARGGPDTGPLRRASVREMQQPHMFASLAPKATLTDDKTPNPKVGFYGYGLHWTRDSRNVVTVGHAGGLPGYGSQYRFAPDHGIGVIAFANLRYGPVYAPTTKALNLLVEKAKLPARTVPASPILLLRQKQVAELIQSWDASLGAAIAAENFFMDRSREEWIAHAREKLAPIGKIKSIGRIKAENQLRGMFPVVGEHGTVDVSFTLTPEREPKVQQVDIHPPGHQ
ncbi:MAG: serine hydrolase domain-containing protein [Telluria sp.]